MIERILIAVEHEDVSKSINVSDVSLVVSNLATVLSYGAVQIDDPGFVKTTAKLYAQISGERRVGPFPNDLLRKAREIPRQLSTSYPGHSVQYSMPPADVASYGWRIAFLFGGTHGLRQLHAAPFTQKIPEFLRMHAVSKNPIRELLQEHRPAVLAAAGVAAVVGGFTGILYGFVPAYLVHSLHYSPSETALALTTLLLELLRA